MSRKMISRSMMLCHARKQAPRSEGLVSLARDDDVDGGSFESGSVISCRFLLEASIFCVRETTASCSHPHEKKNFFTMSSTPFFPFPKMLISIILNLWASIASTMSTKNTFRIFGVIDKKSGWCDQVK